MFWCLNNGDMTMTVTKQQQLEWLARNVHEWPGGAIRISTDMTHVICTYSLSSKAGDWFECQEWQQERDKMQKKPAQPAQDNSWHERGELPHVGCECEILGTFGHYQEWFPCKIIAEHGGSVFAANERAWINVKHGERKFRPLRTEREKAIDAACDIICKNGVHDFERGVITKLYDAGMLK